MPFKTPHFWYMSPEKRSIMSMLLTPLSAFYQVGQCLNTALKPTHQIPIPVICVGNATAGGSGKTPTAIALHHLLIQCGCAQNPFFLTRGYGARDGSCRVIQNHEDAKRTGDEPKILASHSNTIISKNRYNGAKLAQAQGADCIIMDDGLQNPSLKKDVSLLVVDGGMGFGNRKTLPSGPLRQPLSAVLKNIDAIILIGDDKNAIQQDIPEDIPVFHASITIDTENAPAPSDDYIAFAGLGYPQKFLTTLEKHGYSVKNFHSFADHHPYTQEELTRLCEEAHMLHAQLITTEKDYMRIDEEYKPMISTLPISLKWHDEQALIDFLRPTFKKEHNTAVKEGK